MMAGLLKHVRLRLLPYAVAGGVIGCGLSGLIEAVFTTVNTGYGRWTLPFLALGYYGLLGALVGAFFWGVVTVLLFNSKGRLRAGQMFSTSAAAVFIYTAAYPPTGLILAPLNIDFLSIPGMLFLSVLILAGFVILFLAFSTLFNLVNRFTKRPLTVFGIVYIVALFVAGFISAASGPDVVINADDRKPASLPMDKPNVLFLLVDCLRYDYVSANEFNINTPAFQTLADDGILYRNAIANSNWTKTAIASIFTSLTPRCHGVQKFYTQLPRDYRLLAGELRRAGYRTMGISTNPNVTQYTGFDQGFDEFFYLKGMTAIPYDGQAPKLFHYYKMKKLLTALIPQLKYCQRVFTDAEPVTDLAMDWIGENGAGKFFIYIHYMDPHVPYYHHPYNGVSATPYEDDPRGENRDYYASLYRGEVEYCDRQIGRLMDYLKKSDLYDSTLIILTADHGEEFFEHYGWEHSVTMYDEMLHIPLIMKLPNSRLAGSVDSSMVCEIDLAPTILGLLGLQPPAEWEGQDIFDPGFHNGFVASQAINGPEGYRYRLRSIRTLSHKFIVADSGYCRDSLYTYQNKAVDKRGAFPPVSLFDLVSDPSEKNNIFKDPAYRAVADSMLALDSMVMAHCGWQGVVLDTMTLDANTLEQLKALGYLQ